MIFLKKNIWTHINLLFIIFESVNYLKKKTKKILTFNSLACLVRFLEYFVKISLRSKILNFKIKMKINSTRRDNKKKTHFIFLELEEKKELKIYFLFNSFRSKFSFSK